jgi:predicted naringenin-chalcone synthase
VEELLKGAGRVQEEIDLWAVHPGGRAILDAVERCLGLEGQDLAASREVLRACGNMSSPSVLFVLEKLLSKGTGRGAMLSFGPGLSLEGMVWQQGA